MMDDTDSDVSFDPFSFQEPEENFSDPENATLPAGVNPRSRKQSRKRQNTGHNRYDYVKLNNILLLLPLPETKDKLLLNLYAFVKAYQPNLKRLIVWDKTKDYFEIQDQCLVLAQLKPTPGQIIRIHRLELFPNFECRISNVNNVTLFDSFKNNHFAKHHVALNPTIGEEDRERVSQYLKIQAERLLESKLVDPVGYSKPQNFVVASQVEPLKDRQYWITDVAMQVLGIFEKYNEKTMQTNYVMVAFNGKPFTDFPSTMSNFSIDLLLENMHQCKRWDGVHNPYTRQNLVKLHEQKMLTFIYTFRDYGLFLQSLQVRSLDVLVFLNLFVCRDRFFFGYYSFGMANCIYSSDKWVAVAEPESVVAVALRQQVAQCLHALDPVMERLSFIWPEDEAVWLPLQTIEPHLDPQSEPHPQPYIDCDHPNDYKLPEDERKRLWEVLCLNPSDNPQYGSRVASIRSHHDLFTPSESFPHTAWKDGAHIRLYARLVQVLPPSHILNDLDDNNIEQFLQHYVQVECEDKECNYRASHHRFFHGPRQYSRLEHATNLKSKHNKTPRVIVDAGEADAISWISRKICLAATANYDDDDDDGDYEPWDMLAAPAPNQENRQQHEPEPDVLACPRCGCQQYRLTWSFILHLQDFVDHFHAVLVDDQLAQLLIGHSANDLQNKAKARDVIGAFDAIIKHLHHITFDSGQCFQRLSWLLKMQGDRERVGELVLQDVRMLAKDASSMHECEPTMFCK